MTLLAALVVLAPSGVAAFAQDAPATKPASTHHPRVTMEAHFDKANVAHDGHLTLDEAKVGFPAVAKHFHDVDVNGKGYVTQNDVRAWQALRKAAHHPRAKAADALQPRNAFRLTLPGQQLHNTSANRLVALPADQRSQPASPTDAQ